MASLPGGYEAAKAQFRAPDSEAVRVRPHYEWEVSLDHDTRAVVGPIQADRELKLRLELLGAPASEDIIQICLERHCEPLDLGTQTELDLTDRLSALPGDYRRAYLTLQRKNPGRELLTLRVLVETDHTAELPSFSSSAP